MDWLEAQLKGSYEVHKGGRVGPGPDEATELTALNNCNVEATLGLKPLIEQLTKNDQSPTDGPIEFRGLAARANYLSADRIDLQFSAKETCRFMSSPIDTSLRAPKRLKR